MRLPAGSKWLEYGVIALLLAGTAWLGQLTYHNVVVHGRLTQAVPSVAPVELPVTTLTGQAVTLPLAGRDRAVVLLVLSTECPFCEQNMPEWRELAEAIGRLGPGAPELLALSVSPAEDTRRFLREHGVDVPAMLVDRAVLTLLGLPGYPSTVTVNPIDRAMAAYTGVLTSGDQRVLISWARSVLRPGAMAAVQ